MKPIRVLLTYPNNIALGLVIAHLTDLGKAQGRPHMQLVMDEDADADEFQYVRSQLNSRGIKFNNEITDPEDRRLFLEDSDGTTDPGIVTGSLQGLATIEAQRAQQIGDNLIDNAALSEEERLPPSTPTVGREDRAEKADPQIAGREHPGFSDDVGESLGDAIGAQAAADPNDPSR